MNLVKIAGEHTCDLDLLPEEPVVLDVGCRGFVWDRELLKLRPKACIYAVDPDPVIWKPEDLGVNFLACTAVTHWPVKSVVWTGEGEAGYIVAREKDDPGLGWGVNGTSYTVSNVTMNDLLDGLAEHGPSKFDLVKLDCEGSEFGILENWPGKAAKQISVEFHDFFNRRRWNDEYFEKLFSGPLKDYKVVQHELQPIGPGSMGHWDSLLILKEAL